MCFEKFLPVSQQKATSRIHKADIKKLFKDVPDIKLTDSNYKLVDIDHLQKYLQKNHVNIRKYEKTIHDCDDFSYILMGDITRWDSDLAFGILWAYKPDGEYHSLNIAISTDEKVILIEPQTDKIIWDLEEWDLRFVLM